MNRIQRGILKALGLNVAPQRKGMTIAPSLVGTGLPTYIDWQNKDEYLTSDSVYSIIRTIGTKAASIPLYVYKPKADASKYLRLTKGVQNVNSFKRAYLERIKAMEEMRVDNEFSQLLNNPNPSQGADAFYNGVFSFYALFGECFIWLNRGNVEGGRVLEMYLIPPPLVEIIPDRNDLYGVVGYQFNLGGTRVNVPKDAVLHWHNFNPEFDAVNRKHLRGFSPLKAGNKRVQMDSDAADASVSMFQNGGARGVIYNKDLSNLTVVQESELRSLINGKLNNTAVKSAVATLPGEWGYIDIGLSSIDMALLQAQEMSLKRLCAIFGAPYELFQSDTTFANKEMAMKYFITNTIMPMCYSFRDELNRALAPAPLFADFDFSTLPELQDDMQKITDAAAKAWWITPNEKRELSGYEPMQDPLMNRIYAPTGIEDLANMQPVDESLGL